MTKKFVRKTEVEFVRIVGSSGYDIVNDWIEHDKIPPNAAYKIVLEVEEEDGVGQFFWHIHHQILIEKATEPIQNRQDYISKNKSDDAATRLKWMTPVIGPLPEGFEEMYDRVYKGESPATSKNILHSLDIERLHKKEHPDCPWNKHPGDLLP